MHSRLQLYFGTFNQHILNIYKFSDELEHNFRIAEPVAVATTLEHVKTVFEAINMLGSANTIRAVILMEDNVADLPTNCPKDIEILSWTEFMFGTVEDFDMKLPGKPFSETDLTVLPFSSGTTGKAKGVHLCHKGIGANILQMSHSDLSIVGANKHTGQHEIAVGLLPFFHIYGLTCIMANNLFLGNKIVLLKKFEPLILRDMLLDHKVRKRN
jgi:acyl-CoA synthetase (AMP-forming)/AMP-acid ligase II